MTADRFDVVVVGAGPAGCVLANRLTEEAGRSVCVLEAGPDYGPDLAAWPADLRDPTLVWYQSHPWGYQHAGRPPGRPLPLPRARVVGGSSTINACYWLRGSAADYDGWAALGNPGWSFAQLLPYFRRAETDPLGGPLHGTDGPVPVFRAAEDDLTTVDRAFLAAAKALGFDDQPDFNGAAGQRPGVGPMPKNLAGGLRMNAAFTYLNAARTRPNLTLMADVLVDRVVVQNGHAVGVQTSDGRIVGGDEVVLCAGAYGSPAVLMRSGIGDPEVLAPHGIPVVHELRGVGRNLHDHPLVELDFAGSPALRDALAAAADARFIPEEQTLGKLRSSRATGPYDLHLVPVAAPEHSLLAGRTILSVGAMEPRSRGRLTLASPDPDVAPIIDHGYLTDPHDMAVLLEGVERARKLAATAPPGSLSGAEPAPGVGAPLEEAIRRSHVHYYHPVGTCRLGAADDPLAVCDARGRPRGLDRVIVADCSLMPVVPRANTNVPAVVVGEHIADDLLL